MSEKNINMHTQEHVAFELMRLLMPEDDTTRKLILDLYSECLDAVKGKRSKNGNDHSEQ